MNSPKYPLPQGGPARAKLLGAPAATSAAVGAEGNFSGGGGGKQKQGLPGYTSCLGCSQRHPFLSSSTQISEEGPPGVEGVRRKERKWIMSKGIKEMRFQLCASGL